MRDANCNDAALVKSSELHSYFVLTSISVTRFAVIWYVLIVWYRIICVLSKVGIAFSLSVCLSAHKLKNQRSEIDVTFNLRRLSELFCVVLCTGALCTVISTLRWAVLTVLWIGFCLTGPILLCVDLFVFVCFCFILHSCCITVSTVGWTWWDWSLILWTCLSSVLWHCWLGHSTHKNSSPICPIMCLVGR